MLIGELARTTGTTPRALRYYEQQGLLQSHRNTSGYRTYGDGSVLRVKQIQGLLVAGFGSQVIAQLLPCATGPRPAIELCPSVVAAMQDTLNRIDGQLDELAAHRTAISTLLTTD